MSEEKTRKVRSDKGSHRLPVPGPNKALTALDERLTEAIAELAQTRKNLTVLEQWQVKERRLLQEIDNLMAYMDRLNGRAMNTMTQTTERVDPMEVLRKSMAPDAIAAPNPFGDVPPGVGSIPATGRGPKPTSANVAYDKIVTEGGFS